MTQLAGRGDFALLGMSPWLCGMNAYPAGRPDYLDFKPFYIPAFGTASQATPQVDWANANNTTTALIAQKFTVVDPVVQQTPATYIDHAAAATWATYRYGSGNAPNNSSLELAYQNAEGYVNEPVAPKGLATIGFFENHNESDKWWLDNSLDPTRLAQPTALWQMRPEYLAAMTSADYDGHGSSAALQISAGAGVPAAKLGVKNASSSTQFALSGLSNFRTGYLREAMAWWRSFRKSGQYGFVTAYGDNVLPLDAFNFHHYANSASPKSHADFLAYEANVAQYKTPFGWEAKDANPNAISPEAELLKKKLQWTMWEAAKGAYQPTSDANAQAIPASQFQQKQFWLSEFGYDTEISASSAYDVPGATPAQRWLKQAQWSVRSFLEISAARSIFSSSASGITGEYSTIPDMRFSRAHIYELRDEFVPTGQPAVQFQTAGLLAYDAVRQLYTKKNSWYFLAAMREVLQSYTFVEELQVTINIGTAPAPVDGVALPRAYLYKNGTKYRIAWWAPTSYDYSDSLTVTISSPTTAFVPGSMPYYSISSKKPQAYELIAGTERPILTQYNHLGAKVGKLTGDGKSLKIASFPTTETPRFIDLLDVIAEERSIDITAFYQTAVCCEGVRLKWDYLIGPGSSSIPRPFFNVYAIPTSLLPGGPTTYVLGMPGTIDVALGTSQQNAFIGGLQQGVSYNVIVYAVNRTTGAFLTDSLGAPYSAVGNTTVTPSCGSTPCFLPIQASWITASSSASLAEGQSILTYPLTCNLPRPNGSQNDCAPFFVESGRPNWNQGVGEWIVVRFPQPQHIQMIVLEDDYGVGDLVIEGKQCDCESNWTPIVNYRTNSRCFQTFVSFNELGKWREVRFRKKSGDPKIGPVGFCTIPVTYGCNGLDPGPDPGPGPGFAKMAYVTASPQPTVLHNIEGRVTIQWPLPAVELVNKDEEQASSQKNGPPMKGPEVVDIIRNFRVQLTSGGKPIGEAAFLNVLPHETVASFTFENLKAGTEYEAVVTTTSNVTTPEPCLPPNNPSTGGTVVFKSAGPQRVETQSLHLDSPDPTDGANLTYGDWEVFPNPNPGTFSVSHPVGAQQLMIVDVLGRIIYSASLDPTATQTEIQIEVPVTGMHVIALRYSAQTLRRHVHLVH